jgi:transcriptional regulator with PAS, ATPase and Fis domain
VNKRVGVCNDIDVVDAALGMDALVRATARSKGTFMSDVYTMRPVVLVGESEVMREVREIARRVAGGDAKVLLTGESGVGKDLVARYIHNHSSRALRPFVPVNCAAISETLLESELFGHVKGSFTGAYRDKMGRLQLANRGTVFLDELGETSIRMQALLLRFLESGEIHPVGSESIPAIVNVRVIAATNRDLPSLVVNGQFREDLLYRIKVVHLHVPPLRDRVEDVPLLIEHLVKKVGRPIRFSDEAMQHLLAYGWPGNVRELHNVVEQVSWTTGGDLIELPALPSALQTVTPQRAAFRERRRQVADDLYAALTAGHLTFWDDVYPRFLQRDLTRNDVRGLVGRGLEQVGGNYRDVLPLFGMRPADYKRFLNFLSSHDCAVDFRRFRPSRDIAPLGPVRAGRF